MSIHVTNFVWDHYPADAIHSERLVALYLANVADDDGTNIYPPVARIVEKTATSRAAVHRNLQKMKERGWLILVEQGGGGGSGREARNTYRIPFAELYAAAQTVPPVRHLPERGVPPVGPQGSRQWDPPNMYVSKPPSIKPTRVRAGEESSQDGNAPQQELMPAEHADKTGFILPDWIDIETWDAWMEIRKGAKAKNTPVAKKLLLRAIDELRQQGHDSTAVMEQSIRNSWKDAYPLKATGESNGKSTADRQVALLTGRG